MELMGPLLQRPAEVEMQLAGKPNHDVPAEIVGSRTATATASQVHHRYHVISSGPSTGLTPKESKKQALSCRERAITCGGPQEGHTSDDIHDTFK
jgi:hypothetical protein